MHAPQQPSGEQIAALEEAARLHSLHAPEWMNVEDGQIQIVFDLPRYGLSLLRLSW